jgi:hypothetical protein
VELLCRVRQNRRRDSLQVVYDAQGNVYTHHRGGWVFQRHQVHQRRSGALFPIVRRDPVRGQHGQVHNLVGIGRAVHEVWDLELLVSTTGDDERMVVVGKATTVVPVSGLVTPSLLVSRFFGLRYHGRALYQNPFSRARVPG